MTAVPLHDLDEVATRRDIAGLRAATKADVAGLRAEFKSDLAALQKTMTNWMLTLLVAIIGAMASIGFFN